MASMERKTGPLPPADLAHRDLPIETVPVGTLFIRIHRAAYGVLYFSTSGDNRFDDPEGRYGVCYAARSLQGAFAETCLRDVGASFVPMSHLATRSITEIKVAGELRVVELHGTGLARVGATAAVTSGIYNVSQPWSRALYQHRAEVDGVIYRSNHDNSEFCVALFDRCRSRLEEGTSRALLSDRAVLAHLLDSYKIGLG
jgi:hypothetical protein